MRLVRYMLILLLAWGSACLAGYGDKPKSREQKAKTGLSEEELKQLRKGELPEKLIETFSWIGPDTPDGKEFQTRMEAVYDRLFPPEKFPKHRKVRFLLSAEDKPNAFYLGLSKPPIITFTKGLLDLCENDDQLAYVLGHEVTHKHLKEADEGRGSTNSKTEEYYADQRPLPLMFDAGFDPYQGLEMAKKLFDVGSAYEPEMILDVHGLGGNRIEAIEKGLALLGHRRGNIRRAATENPVWKEIAKRTEFKSFMQVELEKAGFWDAKPPKRWSTLTKLLAHLDPAQPRRLRDLLRAVRKTRSPKSMKLSVLHAFADEILNIGEKGATEEEKKFFSGARLDLYEAVGDAVRPSGADTAEQVALERGKRFAAVEPELRPLGRVRRLNAKILAFVQASTAEQIRESARALLDDLARVGVQRRFLHQVGFDGFDAPETETAFQIKRIVPRPAPWNPHVLAARQDSTGLIAEALWAVGIEDPRTVELLDRSKPEKYLSDEGEPFSWRHSVPWRDLGVVVVDTDGTLRGNSGSTGDEDQGWQERYSRRSHVFGQALAAMIDKAMQGDKQVEKALLEIMPAILLEDGFPWGLEHFEKNPDLFIKLNVDSDNARAMEKYHYEKYHGMAVPLLARAEMLMRQDRNKYGPPVAKTIKALAVSIAIESDSPHVKFLLDDPYGLFTREEKLQWIDESFRFLTGTGSDVHDDELTTQDQTQLFRWLGLSQSNTVAGLKAGVARARKLNPPRLAANAAALLFIHYQPANRKEELTVKDILNLLPHLSPHLLRAAAEVTDWLKANVFRDYENWPRNPELLVGAWTTLQGAAVFYSNRQLENEFAQFILQETPKAPPQKQLFITSELLVEGRLEDPRLRTQARGLWVKGMLEKHGLDDQSVGYRKRFLPEVEALASRLNIRDRLQILDQLAHAVQAQGSLSRELAAVNDMLVRSKMSESHGGAVGLEALAEVIRREPPLRGAVLDFLSSPLTDYGVRRFQSKIEGKGSSSVQIASMGDVHMQVALQRLRFLDERAPKSERDTSARLFYENFWALPFEARVPMIDSLLLSPLAFREPHELPAALEYVSRKMFPSDQAYGAESREILSHYMRELPDEMRTPFLAAVLVANEHAGRAAKPLTPSEKFALLLEQMGPAETKLGQAIHSYPDAPEDFRQGLGRLKSSTSVPTREEVLGWYRDRVPLEIRGEVVHVGAVLGAASYYVTLELKMRDGSEAVVSLLRPYARERAEAGFERMKGLARRLGEKNRLYTHLVQLIDHASRMAAHETDSAIYRRQADIASRHLSGYRIEVENHTFDFGPARLLATGEGYRMAAKAQGVHFNDLPTSTDEERAYKRNLARAYVALEVTQLLAGQEFDHDRHGAQVRVDGSQVVLFDHGAMALEPPTVEQRKLLGEIIGGALDAGNLGWTKLASTLANQAQARAKSDPGTAEYLVKVQNALLKLSDFVRVLGPGDLERVLASVVEYGKVHPDVVQGALSQVDPMKLMGLGANCSQFLLKIHRVENP